MTQDIEQFRAAIARRAIQMEIGGFRPPQSLEASWFGRVRLGAPGEPWPEHGGKPMLALAQINIPELPFRPLRLDDVDLIAVFVTADALPFDAPNGDGWCLRAYSELSALVPLQSPRVQSPIRPFPMRPHVIEADFPCWEDLPLEVPDDVGDDYYDKFANVDGFKLGGWPSLVQSEVFWAPRNRHPASPEYVFQIDSSEKGNWSWGDAGVGYFGRGTERGATDEWTFPWQCY